MKVWTSAMLKSKRIASLLKNRADSDVTASAACLGARIAPMDRGISARAWGQLGDCIIHLIAGTSMSFDFRSQCPEARSASFNVGILTQAKSKLGDYIYRQIVGTNMSFDFRGQCLGARTAPMINGQAVSSLADGGERGGLKGFVSVNTREG